MSKSDSWEKILKDNKILEHDFSKSPFKLTAQMIKESVQDFKTTAEKEVRILCKMDRREHLPKIMREKGLFLLPTKNGEYAIIKGEGYIDIEDIEKEAEPFKSELNFPLESSFVGDSEMQHLDYANACGMIKSFTKDETLVLTIRGRKYTPEFSFKVGKQDIDVKSVQTEVDAGYEGKEDIVLVEAKNSETKNTIIRQLYYPFRQWSQNTNKNVRLLFFEKRGRECLFWEYKFEDLENYNSIKLVNSKKYFLSKES